MPVFRAFTVFVLLSSLPALAQADCEDAFTECKDDCLIEFGGSVRVEVKKRYDKCMKKCTKTANRCTERVMETKANQLDDGALDGTPASDEVDESGLPTRSGSDRKKKKAAPEVASESPSDDEPPRKKEALADSEVPKSSRTKLKVEDEPAPAKKPKEEEAAPRKEVIEMKMTPRKEEEDLRDDQPRATAAPRDEEPPPPPKKKVEEKRPPPKKEEDHDDLRNY